MSIILNNPVVKAEPDMVLVWDSGEQELHSYIIIDSENKMHRDFAQVGSWVPVKVGSQDDK